MTDFEVLGPLIVAAADEHRTLCVLVWAVLSGALTMPTTWPSSSVAWR